MSKVALCSTYTTMAVKDLLGRLKNSGNEGELGSKKYATLKTMEHVKRTLEAMWPKSRLSSRVA